MAGTARFRALVADQVEGKTVTALRTKTEADLPPGEVTVRVAYSTLNYKDGLALTGRAPILRSFPMVPGIDCAGTVEASDDARFKPGDRVILTGWGVGERHSGGFAERTRLKADWLVHAPDGLELRHAMAIGTAGLTAMLCLGALERAGIGAGAGPVAVTGAAGGVGSLALALLARHGYEAWAVTGRPALEAFLKGLGASGIVPRAELAARPERPLLKERWAGAIDSVGGDTLAHLLAETRYGGAVAACGLAGGSALGTTVLPVILRGVSLIGIDSVMCLHEPRVAAWRRLAAELPAATLEALSETIPLESLPAYAERILKGEVRGRVVVDVNG
jgi:acrylyl-CoA reductase (NADPH)